MAFACLAAGLPEQAGAAAGGGGGEEAEEGVEGGAADEGAEPEGAAACANIQVGVGLSYAHLSQARHLAVKGAVRRRTKKHLYTFTSRVSLWTASCSK